MTFVTPIRFGWSLLLASSLVACSGGGGFAGGSRSSDSKKSGDSDKDEAAGDPTEVAGAFLVDCSFIDSGVVFGCTARENGTKKMFSTKEYEVETELFNDAGDQVEMQVKDSPEGSSFHQIASLPEAYKDSGKVRMTVTPIKGGTALQSEIDTTDIKKPEGQMLGNPDPEDFETGTPADLKDVAIDHFKIMGVWIDKNGVAFGSAIPTEFCDGGILRKTLGQTSQTITGITKGLFDGLFSGGSGSSSGLQINMQITPHEATIDASSKVCFKEFRNEAFSGKAELAHIGGGCILLRGSLTASGQASEGIMIGKDVDENGKKIDVEDVREFARRKNANCF